VNLAVQERADRQHDGFGFDTHPGLGHDAACTRALEQQAVDVLL
jgi:hypothetical protein